MKKIPDFLIIGTMKGGTTVLYEFINTHDEVDEAKQKEIHYFSLYPYKSIDWYLDHFDTDNNKMIGEASPTYFDIAYTHAIPMGIKQLAPEIKLILIVRNPIERAVSHFFHYRIINKVEKLQEMDINEFFSHSYEDALKQTSAIDYYLHSILSCSVYYRKLQTYLSVFDRKNLLILTNNELKTDPQNTMKKVFEFLDLEPIQSDKFDKFKYSTGSDISHLEKNTFNKLENYLYPDYKAFCEVSDISFPQETDIL